MRMAPRLVLGLVSALCGAGCASRPVQQAFLEPLPIPHFALDALPVTQVSAAVPIELIDDRPDWERESYGGITRYKALHGGTSFFPLESLEPPLHEHLRTELTARMGSVPDRPESVTLRLTSFRVVYRQIGQDEAIPVRPHVKSPSSVHIQFGDDDDDDDDEWDSMRPDGWPCDHKESFIEDLLGDFLSAALYAVVLTPIVRATQDPSPRVEKLYEAEEQALAPLPKALGNDYVPGVTCEMQGELTIGWPGRPEYSVAIESRSESWHTVPTLCDVESVVPALVHNTIADFGTKVVNQAMAAQGQSAPPK